MKSVVLVFILAATVARAQTNDLTSLLQQGLLEEQANRNLDAAIADYQTLAAQFDKNRQLAATAIFRLGECYRMQNQTNEAAAQYQRILKDFSDQPTLATLSRQNLAGMGLTQNDSGKTINNSSAISTEAAALASQISGIEKLKANPTEYAQAVQAIFPDENLKKMLENLPNLQGFEVKLKAKAKVSYNEYCVAVHGRDDLRDISGTGILMSSDPTNLLANVELELQNQNSWISERVDFVLGIQKARLKVLQSSTGTVGSENNSDVALWDKLKDMPRSEVEKILPTLVPDESLNSLLQQRDSITAKITELGVDYFPSNAVVLRQKAALNAVQKQIDARTDGLLAALKMRAEISGTARTGGVSNTDNSSDEESQEIQRIQTMIQNSPDLINAANSDGTTPLQKAAANGWLKVAAYLLDHGADVNNRSGTLPLVVAATAGNKAMTQFLLDHGADVNAKNSDGKTPLIISAERSFPAVMEVLLANKADINALENWGRTPLMWAAWQQRNGSEKIMAMLLEQKPDVNTQDKSGGTALMNAAVSGSLENVKALLAAGANPNFINNDGRTALSFAAKNKSPEMVKMLLDAKADPNAGTLDLPLLVAIQAKDTNSGELLLQAGANPNAKGIVDFSIQNNLSSASPLFLAVITRQFPMVQLLLKFKADPNDSQTDNRSLLFSALSDTNIVEVLLDAGAQVDARNTVIGNGGRALNWTPLLYAVQSKADVDSVGILLKHGANPNVRDPDGNTPLHWAAYNVPDKKVFQWLLDSKADPNVRNNQGETPLDILKRVSVENYGNISSDQKTWAAQLTDFLRQHGALDKLPDWDHIAVSRPSANFSQAVFAKGTNDWNRFTLLEAILNFYGSGRQYSIPQGNSIFMANSGGEALPFPDLSRIIIRRPIHDSTNQTVISVNFLNSSNGIDVSKDVPLEFGDVVEIPEHDHALSDQPVGLTDGQSETLYNFLKGNVRLNVHGQTVEIPVQHYFDSSLKTILALPAARNLLLSSSDLTKVKITRQDSKTGKKHEWIFDSSDRPASGQNGAVAFTGVIVGGANNSASSTDFMLRDGDVIEVPEKE